MQTLIAGKIVSEQRKLPVIKKTLNTDGKSRSYFHSTGTHWHHDYDKSIARCENDIKKLQGKLKKDPNSKRASKWIDEIKAESEHMQSLIHIQERLDKEMLEQQKELIKENKE